MDLFEKTLNSNLKFDGKIIKLKYDEVELPDGSKSCREYVCHNGGAGILPLSKDGKVALAKQFRYPYKEVIYEIPAGKIDLGETPIEAVKRELFEEVGGKSEKIIDLGIVYPTPGYTNEKIYVYLALDTTFDKQKLDDGEFLEVDYFDFEEVLQMIDDNTIKDSKTIIAVLKAEKLLANIKSKKSCKE